MYTDRHETFDNIVPVLQEEYYLNLNNRLIPIHVKPWNYQHLPPPTYADGQEQSNCNDCHYNRRYPPQDVRKEAIDLVFHNPPIIADEHNHEQQRRRDDPVQDRCVVQSFHRIYADQVYGEADHG